MKIEIVFGTIVLIVSVAIVRSLYVIQRLIPMYFRYTLQIRPIVIEQLCTYMCGVIERLVSMCVFDMIERLISMYFLYILWRRPNVIEQLCTYVWCNRTTYFYVCVWHDRTTHFYVCDVIESLISMYVCEIHRNEFTLLVSSGLDQMCVWHDSSVYVCVTWLIYTCDITDLYVCVAWFICIFKHDKTRVYMRHKGSMCVCDMTHLYICAWHDSFVQVT